MNKEIGMTITEWLALAARLIVGATLLTSGFLKLIKPAASFAAVIESYKLIPPEAALTLATALPWVEYLVGGCLLAGYWTRQAAGTAAALFFLFTAALTSTLVRGIELNECGCFGANVHLTAKQAIGLDILLLALASLVLWVNTKRLTLDRWIEK